MRFPMHQLDRSDKTKIKAYIEFSFFITFSKTYIIVFVLF